MEKKVQKQFGEKKKKSTLAWEFFSTKPDMSMILLCPFYSKLQSEASQSAKIAHVP